MRRNATKLFKGASQENAMGLMGILDRYAGGPGTVDSHAFRPGSAPAC